MTLICKKCNAGDLLEIVDAEEQRDDDGFVVKFNETYECGLCEGRGVLFADSTGGTNDQTLTGILGSREDPYV